MISFEGATPAWNDIPALRITTASHLTDDKKSLLMQTEAGPAEISLHGFGARLRLGKVSATDYGMLVE